MRMGYHGLWVADDRRHGDNERQGGRPMAWVQRGPNQYYYGWEHVDGRRVYTYFGGGASGEAAAAEFEARRLQRQHELRARQAARRQLQEALSLTRTLDRECERIATAALAAAGFHSPHYKAWRRKRVRRKRIGTRPDRDPDPERTRPGRRAAREPGCEPADRGEGRRGGGSLRHARGPDPALAARG